MWVERPFESCFKEEESGRDKRRTASLSVGWKSPPNLECAFRWVGRT